MPGFRPGISCIWANRLMNYKIPNFECIFHIHGLGDVSDMRLWALGPAFHAHVLGHT